MAYIPHPYGFRLEDYPYRYIGRFPQPERGYIDGTYSTTIRPGDPLVRNYEKIERYQKQPTNGKVEDFSDISSTEIIGIFRGCKYESRGAASDLALHYSSDIEKPIWPAWTDAESARQSHDGSPPEVIYFPVSEGYLFSVHANGTLPDKVKGMYANICERKPEPGSAESAVQLAVDSLSDTKGNLPLQVMKIKGDQYLIVKFV